MDPTAHALHLAKLLESKPPEVTISMKPGGPALSAPLGGVAPPSKDKSVETEAAAAEAETETDAGAETEAPETPAARTEAPAPEGRAADRIKRSIDIERRAQANRRRAQTEAANARREREDAARRAKEVQRRETTVERAAEELRRELELLKTDAPAFMRSHGMSAVDIANYVKQGADPTSRRIDLLESRVGQALEGIQKGLEKKLERLTSSIAQEREEASTAEFVEYVASDLDRFEALNTIYGKEELLSKANALAERNEKLRLGWDSDKLCEELEARARKDTRWQRVQARYARRTDDKKPYEPAKPSPNAPQRDKGAAPSAGAEAGSRAKPRRQPPAGTPRETTPDERHRTHVERLLRTTRLFG